MNEVWICHHSVAAWTESETWTAFFEHAQTLLGSSLTHLDTNDPVRRKVTSVQDAGQFICTFGPAEESRWLLGKFRGIGIDISIQHYRRCGHYANAFKWHVPLDYCERPDGWKTLRNLFSLGNEYLCPFYSYTDTMEAIAALAAKKKATGAIDIQAELLGVFWLTYFCAAYVQFFGRDTFAGLPGAAFSADGGASLQLAESPVVLSQEDRDKVLSALGRTSFVETDNHIPKPRGRFALTFEQLRNYCK